MSSTTLNRLDLRGIDGDLRHHLPRPGSGGDEPVTVVRAILDDVRARGDEAVREYTARFDGVELDALRVPAADLDAIEDFHRAQLRPEHRYERDGLVVRGRPVPVDRAGVYVPGGRGAYPSTVLMTAVPAKVAGVGEVVLCVPPDRTTGAVAP